VQERSKRTVWVSGGCKSYYAYQKTGRDFALWPTFTFTFRNMTRHFDAKAYTTHPLSALGRSGVTA